MQSPPVMNTLSKIKEAREMLKERAGEILSQYIDTIVEARDAGEFEVATKGLQWLIEHMPADAEGEKVLDTSIDKQQKSSEKLLSPTFNIGFQLGGVTPQQVTAVPERKALPEVLDGEVDGSV